LAGDRTGRKISSLSGQSAATILLADRNDILSWPKVFPKPMRPDWLESLAAVIAIHGHQKSPLNEASQKILN